MRKVCLQVQGVVSLVAHAPRVSFEKGKQNKKTQTRLQRLLGKVFSMNVVGHNVHAWGAMVAWQLLYLMHHQRRNLVKYCISCNEAWEILCMQSCKYGVSGHGRRCPMRNTKTMVGKW